MSDEKNTPDWQRDSDTVVEDSKAEAKEALVCFKVVLLNDDYTPMEFVVELLEQFFSQDSRENATRIMLKYSHRGKGRLWHLY